MAFSGGGFFGGLGADDGLVDQGRCGGSELKAALTQALSDDALGVIQNLAADLALGNGPAIAGFNSADLVVRTLQY